MEEVVLQAGDADDWVYKGEGAANLILSYTGSSTSMLGKVLRAKKILNDKAQPAPNCVVFSSSEQLLWGEIPELTESVKQDCLPQAYAQVMSQHLGADHVDGGVRARVSKEFLEIIGKNVLNSRPAWRVNASAIDTSADSALLISDHSLFSGKPSGSSCIAVEIKAKCGFLPSSEYISKENAIKKQVTRFKMHERFRLYQEQILKASDYDPLDLFSGSKERICTAINSFFSTPQSNFRIFVNGSLGFGAMGGGADTEKCLQDLSKVSGLQQSDFTELLSEAISKSGVLDKLLATQKLDDHDIEGAIHLYYNIISQPCLVCRSITDAELLRKYSLLHSLSLDKSCKIVRDFLIAATAKECSLMMCFRPRECETTDSEYDSVILKSVNRTYDYKAYFVDMDVKPVVEMQRDFKLDQNIVKFYSIFWSSSPEHGRGVVAGRKGKEPAVSSSLTREKKRELEGIAMEEDVKNHLRKVTVKRSPDPFLPKKEMAMHHASVRSLIMSKKQNSIESLPRFEIDMDCSSLEMDEFFEDIGFRFQLLASFLLVLGVVATPPETYSNYHLIELMEKVPGTNKKRSMMQFVVDAFNNYLGAFRLTPDGADRYKPHGFFAFMDMKRPLPDFFGDSLIMGHGESYGDPTLVECRAGFLRLMFERLRDNFDLENYKDYLVERQPYLDAPMVFFGEFQRSAVVQAGVRGTEDGPFGSITGPVDRTENAVYTYITDALNALIHNWSALSKVGLWLFVAVLELGMNLEKEALISFIKGRRKLRECIHKLGPRVVLDLYDKNGVFSLKKLLGEYLILLKYEEEAVLRCIMRHEIGFTATYDRLKESESNIRLMRLWDSCRDNDVSDCEEARKHDPKFQRVYSSDKVEWERWLRIKAEPGNRSLLERLMA